MMDDISRAVQNMYNQAGGYFSKTREKSYGKSSNWPETQNCLDRLVPGQIVLDVGCGDGRLLTGLPDGVEYLGIDFSKTLIEIAKSKYPTREFRLANITDNTCWVGLGKFDVVCSVATLHHIPSREKQIFVLSKMKEACMTGGRGYLTVWNLWNERLVSGKLKNKTLESGEMQEMSFDKTPGRYVMAMDLGYMVKLVSEAGWEIEEIYYADRKGNRVDLRQGKNLVVIMSC